MGLLDNVKGVTGLILILTGLGAVSSGQEFAVVITYLQLTGLPFYNNILQSFTPLGVLGILVGLVFIWVGYELAIEYEDIFIRYSLLILGVITVIVGGVTLQTTPIVAILLLISGIAFVARGAGVKVNFAKYLPFGGRA